MSNDDDNDTYARDLYKRGMIDAYQFQQLTRRGKPTETRQEPLSVEEELLMDLDNAQADLTLFKRIVGIGGLLAILEAAGVVSAQILLHGSSQWWLTFLGTLVFIATACVALVWGSAFVGPHGEILPARELRYLQRKLNAHYLAQ